MRAMRSFVSDILFITLLILFAGSCKPLEPPMPQLTYPTPRKDAIVDDFGGTKVPDPYRWMEALDSREVADWVAASNAVSGSYLKQLPLREHFSKRLTELWSYPRVSVPVIEGGRLFYERNTGLQRQSPVFVRTGFTGPSQLVIDPNLISEDGSVSLSQWRPSPDATLVAYGLSEGGADWNTVRVRDVASGRDLSDHVKWMRFSRISWTKDSKGFYYARYPEPPENKLLEAALSGHAIYYHRIGTPQSQDVLVYERRDLPTWVVSGEVTQDGRYLLVTMFEGAGNRNRLYYADLGRSHAPRIDAPIRPVIETDDAEYAPVGVKDSMVFIRSDKDAPNRKVLAVNLDNPARTAWKTVVPEREQAIENVTVIGGRDCGAVSRRCEKPAGDIRSQWKRSERRRAARSGRARRDSRT